MISDIFMLERGKVDPSTTTATTTTTQTTATKASTTTTTTTVPTTQTTTTPTTTAETSTTEPVTTLEYTNADMFTDTVKDIDDSTVTFSEHGQYRFLSADIREQFDSFVIGDEITIGFEFTKVNDTDTPRIDKIVMLSKTKPAIGDVNQDGKIDARDASDILKYYAENSVNTQIDQIKAQSMSYYGDLNGDGKTDAKDASDVLAIYASNSTQPSDESKAVWTEVEISDSVRKTSITYEPFDLEKIKGETDLVFRGTVTDRKEYSVEWLDENGEKWGPYPSSVIEVKIDEIYSGEYDKNTIKVYYPLSFSQLLTSSFLIKDDTSYIFIANSFDEDWFELKANNPYDRFEQEKYADVYITNSRDAIMPITDGIVSVYDEYVADNAEAVSKAIAREEIEDKIPEEIKDSKRFYFYSIEDIKSLLAELF